MSLARSALVVLAAFSNVADAGQSLPEWQVFGSNKAATYEFARQSLVTDPTSLTTEFVMRVTLKDTRVLDGKSVKFLVQRTLAMCAHNALVIMDEERRTSAGELIGVVREAAVYPNQMIQGEPVAEIMQHLCGIKTREKPAAKKLGV